MLGGSKSLEPRCHGQIAARAALLLDLTPEVRGAPWP